MNYKKLKDIHQKLQKVKKKPFDLRLQWPDKKEVICNTLKEIKEKLHLEAKVKIEDKVKGMEIVYLSFGKTDSGLYERVGNTRQPIIKEGGHLFYTQIYNGKVAVWRTLPSIKKIMQSKKPKKLGIYFPSEITEELIMEHVYEFLNALVEWEDQELSSKGIGYKMN